MTARITLSILAIALGGSLTGCAGSSETTVADDDPNRTVCRTDPNTGSRLPKRICKTAAEWDEIAARNLEERRHLSRDQRVGSPAAEGARVQ